MSNAYKVFGRKDYDIDTSADKNICSDPSNVAVKYECIVYKRGRIFQSLTISFIMKSVH